MPTPGWVIEWAPTNAVQGIFRIGVSKIGGPDVIGGQFAFRNFVAITADVKKVSWRRGRTDDLSQMQPGSAVVVLEDPDGDYDPNNPLGANYGNLKPMRPIRVKLTHPGTATTYTQFYGFIQTIEHNPDPLVGTTTIECIDLFEWLDKTYPTIEALANRTVSQLIAVILNHVGWTDTTMRSLSAGGLTVPSFSADGSASALSLIRDLLAVDQGFFYISGAGVATYRRLGELYKNRAVAATFTEGNVGALRSGVQALRIINRQKVTRTGGVEQTAESKSSQRDYGIRDGAAITSPYLPDDAKALSLATWKVGLYENPTAPAKQLLLKNSYDAGATLTQQLARELGDLVTVNMANGTVLTGIIDQITQESDDVGLFLYTTFNVTKRNKAIFTIGVSKIGGADVIGL